MRTWPMRGTVRRAITGAVAIVLAVAIAYAGTVGASVMATNQLKGTFEQQFWQATRYPNAQLLGSNVRVGKLVVPGVTGVSAAAGADQNHCDFAAVAAFGTADEFEAVDAAIGGRTIQVGNGAPVEVQVQPASERALGDQTLRPGEADDVLRETMVRAGVDLSRARAYRTVYLVETISWGHPASLDWRCR